MYRKNTHKDRPTWGDLYGDDAHKPHAPVSRNKADAAHLKSQRKRQRHQDRQYLTVTAQRGAWDNYSHPRHPFDAYGLPSW